MKGDIWFGFGDGGLFVCLEEEDFRIVSVLFVFGSFGRELFCLGLFVFLDGVRIDLENK